MLEQTQTLMASNFACHFNNRKGKNNNEVVKIISIKHGIVQQCCVVLCADLMLCIKLLAVPIHNNQCLA